MDNTQAHSGHDILTAIAAIDPAERRTALAIYPGILLRDAADLCGVDSVDMTKKQAISAIIDNF